MLRDLLQKRECFKLICGAGNEDISEIEKLVAIYAKAGARLFDLAATEEAVNAAIRGLKRVIPENEIKKYHLCISVGVRDDAHVRKAKIDESKCISCGKCMEKCPNQAILSNNVYSVNNQRCIGCGICKYVCETGAISFYTENKSLEEIIPPLVKLGVDSIELHASGNNKYEIYDKWRALNKYFDGILSVCIGRSHCGNEKLLEQIRFLLDCREDYTTIIQADGTSMSGSDDNYKTTLQAVAIAELIHSQNLPGFLILSGGTNSKTAELAKLCNIDIHGVAMGSFARKAVKDYIIREDFWESKVFNSAVEIAQQLVSKTLSDMK